MKLVISGKNIDITQGIRNMTEKKFDKLEKYFFKDVEVKVTMNVEKERHIVEVTIPFAGTILRAEETTESLYDSIDDVVEVLERQVIKHKTKLQKRKHTGETIRFDNVPSFKEEEDTEPRIVKMKSFPMKPMSPEEAVLQMELLRHDFYVFSNADTDAVNVVYKRKDGNYGLIERDY
ncbi:MAG: ribosome-associated translation inhibitor RaiA [Tissierellales bacterium]|jgi:putative sigma-54 modulation protein|nr:ribosome-associated translation inhibitor RaiA [Tissierellales bacterium]